MVFYLEERQKICVKEGSNDKNKRFSTKEYFVLYKIFKVSLIINEVLTMRQSNT